MKSFKDIDKYRITEGILGTSPEDSEATGAFALPFKSNTIAVAVATDGKHDHVDTGWEHVAVHVKYRFGGKKKKEKSRRPTLDEIEAIKNLFWEKDEPVMILFSQDGVNGDGFSANVHLWAPSSGFVIPRPDPEAYTAGLNFVRMTSTGANNIEAEIEEGLKKD